MVSRELRELSVRAVTGAGCCNWPDPRPVRIESLTSRLGEMTMTMHKDGSEARPRLAWVKWAAIFVGLELLWASLWCSLHVLTYTVRTSEPGGMEVPQVFECVELVVHSTIVLSIMGGAILGVCVVGIGAERRGKHVAVPVTVVSIVVTLIALMLAIAIVVQPLIQGSVF